MELTGQDVERPLRAVDMTSRGSGDWGFHDAASVGDPIALFPWLSRAKDNTQTAVENLEESWTALRTGPTEVSLGMTLRDWYHAHTLAGETPSRTLLRIDLLRCV
jgi:hypothetical protein